VNIYRALVITGDGINCEQETAEALRLAKFHAEIKHLNDLIAEQLSLDEISQRYSVLALPGGFSFGDDLASGKVLALKIQHKLKWNLNTYASRGGLVIGICNGFQALIRMGVFGSEVSIMQNSEGRFLNQWVKVNPTGSRCVWLKGMGTTDLPIRHGEGRVVFEPGRKTEVLDKMNRQGMLCLRYERNPNGSEEGLAGLCDSTGRIFGLMPHPEAFVRWSAHPQWQPERAHLRGHGLMVFENAFHFVH
jgi:phosphoribosylformylglycinamidine synthase